MEKDKRKKLVRLKTNADYHRRQRNAVIEALGHRCVLCGFSDARALQVDHINGGGSIERKNKNFTGQFNNYVLKSFLNKEDKYQLLCANCNWIKRAKNNEVRRHDYSKIYNENGKIIRPKRF